MSNQTAGPVLTVDVERCTGDVFVVHCHGKLVAGSTEPLYKTVVELIPGAKRIVLDLADLKHTDSSGIGTLVRLYMKTKPAGCTLQLMHLSQQIRSLLGLTDLLSIFAVVGEHGVKLM
jgi:anti-sigma B factor antagonist